MNFSLLNNNFNNYKNKNEIIEKSFQIWNLLPSEILNKIFDLLPDINKVFLNKEFYFKYHFIIKSSIHIDNYKDYIYFMIKEDNSFVMERILKENLIKWLHWKNYRFQIIYPSYSKPFKKDEN